MLPSLSAREKGALGTRVTIQDIADELGLSRNTVSKALNNAGGIADETRARIIQKAMEMGYKQFAYASAILAAQQDRHMDALLVGSQPGGEIALLSASFLGGSHFASLTLDWFQNEITKLGFTLGMHRVTENHLADCRLPITFRRECVTAIICFEMFDKVYDDMLCQLGIPILFVDGPAKVDGKSLPADQLYMDNTTGITQLVNDMLAVGRTRIGFIGNYRHCQSFYERYAAFRLAMLLAGVPVEDRFCIEENKMVGIAPRLEQLDELPDVFVCANDFVALDALQVMRGLGYDVPRDVWLTGFDDSSESRNCMPRLTTVHIHTQVMAFSAVQLLRTRLREPSLDYRQLHTETTLIYRESTPLS